ncbi:MAG TPA: PHP domain-containing protein [Chthoniobacterales bacterium]
MLHRFELHCHSWYSADAADSPEDLIARARAQGLSGLAITDHNTCDAAAYLESQGLLRPDGLPVEGFLVIPAVEVSTADGHLICLGVTLPNRVGVPAVEVAKEIRARGGVPIPAHPYDRWRAGIREEVLDQLPIRVIEVFNAAVTSREYNVAAHQYAAARGLVGMAGSDAHHASAIGTAVTALELESLSVANVLAQIEIGAALEERYLNRWEGVKKHFGNWFRVFNRRPKPEPSN